MFSSIPAEYKPSAMFATGFAGGFFSETSKFFEGDCTEPAGGFYSSAVYAWYYIDLLSMEILNLDATSIFWYVIYAMLHAANAILYYPVMYYGCFNYI